MNMKDEELIHEFVSTFEKLGDLWANAELDPIAWALAEGDGEVNEMGYKRWRPARYQTAPFALNKLYEKLPTRFPLLYETLVLSYRWAEVDLGQYRLLANPPGPDLNRLLTEMCKNRFLWETLIPAGYLLFGKGLDVNYDPVCFDVRHRRPNRDCPIVQIDHEAILCHSRVRVITELAPTFREPVSQTITAAK